MSRFTSISTLAILTLAGMFVFQETEAQQVPADPAPVTSEPEAVPLISGPPPSLPQQQPQPQNSVSPQPQIQVPNNQAPGPDVLPQNATVCPHDHGDSFGRQSAPACRLQACESEFSYHEPRYYAEECFQPRYQRVFYHRYHHHHHCHNDW